MISDDNKVQPFQGIPQHQRLHETCWLLIIMMAIMMIIIAIVIIIVIIVMIMINLATFKAAFTHSLYRCYWKQ